MDRKFSWSYKSFCCILLMVGLLPSLGSECKGDSCRDVISMPLLDDMKATLKADLDVTNMNNHLKAYIEQQVQKGVETAMKDVMRQLIDNKLEEANATIEATILTELERYGITYVRWGRKSCSDGAELVYTGQAGGNRYNYNGGGVNYLCLPNDPENGEHQSYNNPQLFGAEYEITADWNPRGMSGILSNREVPCAVCHRKRRSSVITIPGIGVTYVRWGRKGCPDGAELVYTGIGVTYVRWGRKGCPDGAELVYTGQAGGNRYNHNGGGVNYLCLPNDPENGEHQSFGNPQLFGAEYEIFADRNPRGMSGILGNREVPCAVCRRKRRSSVITIPGRKTCYKDWNAEYNGYLMASHNKYKRTDYACIDVNAVQFDNKSAYNEDGALFYPIRTSCGSLRCPPYREDADVLCVWEKIPRMQFDLKSFVGSSQENEVKKAETPIKMTHLSKTITQRKLMLN